MAARASHLAAMLLDRYDPAAIQLSKRAWRCSSLLGRFLRRQDDEQAVKTIEQARLRNLVIDC